jgi:hypothetical protein
MFDKAHKNKREILLKVVAIFMIISFVGFAVAPAFLR